MVRLILFRREVILMDEQERDQLGEGEDNFSEGAKNIKKAADAMKGSDSGSGDTSKGGESASGNTDSSSDPPDSQASDNNSDTPDTQNSGTDTGTPSSNNTDTGTNTSGSGGSEAGSNAPASKNPESGANPNMPKGADQGAGQAGQKGAEAGASQSAQKGMDAGANTAQKGAEMGASAVEKSAEAANAAAATVKAGAETGKAVSEIAAGTATGGPWGAILMAAWSMRHTLFKILVVVCLLLMFFVALVVSLPSIIFNNLFRTDPATAGTAAMYDMHDLFDEMAVTVADCVTAGYDSAFAEVEKIIADGSYNYEHSMQALINYGATSADYDICYVLSAYSMAMEQRGTTKQDMINKLTAVKDQMFSVTYEVKEKTITIPAEDEDSEPTEETISFVECTIHPFDQSVILKAFGIDPTAMYGQFNITCELAINNMAMALKMTMYGTVTGGSVPPITDIELADFLAKLECSQKRKDLMSSALSLVGRVPYFWGGKSAAGWNDDWNTPKLVTSIGSSSTDTIRPYGLDCSGFTDWVYKTALGTSISTGSVNQWDNSTAITKSQLLPGDLGFMAQPGTVAINHVLMYAGTDSSGNLLWVHCSSGTGVVLNSPNYVKFYRRPNGIDWGE